MLSREYKEFFGLNNVHPCQVAAKMPKRQNRAEMGWNAYYHAMEHILPQLRACAGPKSLVYSKRPKAGKYDLQMARLSMAALKARVLLGY